MSSYRESDLIETGKMQITIISMFVFAGVGSRSGRAREKSIDS